MPTVPSNRVLCPTEQELGGYPEEIFDGMTDAPVAAASLGQVR